MPVSFPNFDIPFPLQPGIGINFRTQIFMTYPFCCKMIFDPWGDALSFSQRTPDGSSPPCECLLDHDDDGVLRTQRTILSDGTTCTNTGTFRPLTRSSSSKQTAHPEKTLHLPEFSETHSSSRVRQHYSTSRSQKASRVPVACVWSDASW